MDGFHYAARKDLGVGGWGPGNPYRVRILKSVWIIGPSELLDHHEYNHTIIGVFIGFVCVLTTPPFLGPGAPNLQGGRWRARKVRRAIGFHGNRFVSTENTICSHGSATWPMWLDFCMCTLLWHRNLFAKNGQNLPCGTRDSTLQTTGQPDPCPGCQNDVTP